MQRLVLRTFFRGAHWQSYAQLRERALVEVTGADGRQLLHGLVTADVLHAVPLRAQYTMFLNVQGRVLYEALLYHVSEERVLVECDRRAVHDLIKHLKMHALRKKVGVQVQNDLTVMAAPPESSTPPPPSCLLVLPDPRLQALGQRIITTTPGSVDELSHGGDEADSPPSSHYQQHRLEMGVAEGTDEIPPGQLLPFELNIDYLQGVSFTKGCYLGQELTARTHHTGVVRRRAVPLLLKDSPSGTLPWGSNITLCESGKRIGRVLGHSAHLALGIVRLPDVQHSEQVCVEVPIGSVRACWRRPDWWPPDASHWSQSSP